MQIKVDGLPILKAILGFLLTLTSISVFKGV